MSARAQHTAGPWRVEHFDHNPKPCILGPDGHNGPIYIAEVEPETATDRLRCTAPKADARGNGLLIAAAPDLLAACEAIMEAAPTLAPAEPEYNTSEEAFYHGHEVARWEAAQTVRAAIAKARGTT